MMFIRTVLRVLEPILRTLNVFRLQTLPRRSSALCGNSYQHHGVEQCGRCVRVCRGSTPGGGTPLLFHPSTGDAT